MATWFARCDERRHAGYFTLPLFRWLVHAARSSRALLFSPPLIPLLLRPLLQPLSLCFLFLLAVCDVSPDAPRFADSLVVACGCLC